MNSRSSAAPSSSRDFESQALAPAVFTTTQPFYWSVRRELWENRSIYVAPLAVGAVTLFGFLIASIGRAMSETDLLRRRAVLAEPLSFAMDVIMATALIVGVFYSLDALHGERRDRSILFWKSLPVSDLTTVLSKASIPLFVLPLLTFVIIVATQLIMLLLSSLVLLGSGISIASLWTPVFPMSLGLLYHLATLHVLWHAPIYGWLLLVSGWARRAAFLWATLPWLAICGVEKVAFNTTHFVAMLGNRFAGPDAMAGATSCVDSMTHIAPGSFLGNPGLWVGLVIAAAFLAAAVRLRRCQGPI